MSLRGRPPGVEHLGTRPTVARDLAAEAARAQIAELSNDDVLTFLETGPRGLSAPEAQRRLITYGPNHLEKQREESLLVSFLKQFIHLFALILWAAAALALIAEWSMPGEGMAKVAVAIVVVIVISGVFSFWQEHRAEQTLASLLQLLPRRADVLRDGNAVEILIEQLVPGDVVLLESGDHIPADCRLIEAFSVQVNTAVLTGEPMPATRAAGPTAATDLLHSRNVLLAGTSMVSGQAKAVVFATGMQTEFGKIARLTEAPTSVISPLRAEIEHLSRWLAMLSVLLGLVFFAVGRLTGVPFWKAFIFAIGIIVAMVPEGLLPTLTLALVLATRRMAARHVLIRHLPSLGTLGSTTVICTDKTGTLTQNRMLVKQLFVGDTHHAFDPSVPPHWLAELYLPFFLIAGLCHDLRAATHLGAPLLLGDPMEMALAEMARSVLPTTLKTERAYELPFDTERLRMSTVHTMPTGPILCCKGAPESVAPLCARVLLEGEPRPFTPQRRTTVLAAQNTMAEQGLRVLALAYRPLDSSWTPDGLEKDLVWAGLVGVHDPPRHEVQDALRKCREAGVRVIMTTGDHPRTALAIAREVGLVQSEAPSVITGEMLRQYSEIELRRALESSDIIFARITADQKLRIVDALMRSGHVVAVTGDGVNDAPALKNAHVGVAMGIMGTDVAKEAADVVLLDDSFASIVNAIEEGRAVFENIRKFLTYILAHNVPELLQLGKRLDVRGDQHPIEHEDVDDGAIRLLPPGRRCRQVEADGLLLDDHLELAGRVGGLDDGSLRHVELSEAAAEVGRAALVKIYPAEGRLVATDGRQGDGRFESHATVCHHSLDSVVPRSDPLLPVSALRDDQMLLHFNVAESLKPPGPPARGNETPPPSRGAVSPRSPGFGRTGEDAKHPAPLPAGPRGHPRCCRNLGPSDTIGT